MHIRWRGLELPSRVIRDEDVSTDTYARFVIEPFEQGFGTTIGNSLRRVLLSSLEGAAVTSVKIDGVAHEFTSIDGVLEDVTDIILNIKGIVLTLDADEPGKMTVDRDKAGEVRAGDIAADAAIQIANPDHLIATLTADVPFHVEMSIGKGRGYVPGSENRTADSEPSVIPVDSIFSPVLRVRYRTEDMRVGQRTNFDRLILEVWTDAALSPEDALVEAGLILRKHLNPFVAYHELGDDLVSSSQPVVEPISSGTSTINDLLDKSVSVLDLSVRARNCLEAAKTATLRHLVSLTEAELLRFRSFGKTSLHEVSRKLAEMGLSLGMKINEEGAADHPDRGNTTPGQSDAAEDSTGDDPPVATGAGPLEASTIGE